MLPEKSSDVSNDKAFTVILSISFRQTLPGRMGAAVVFSVCVLLGVPLVGVVSTGVCTEEKAVVCAVVLAVVWIAFGAVVSLLVVGVSSLPQEQKSKSRARRKTERLKQNFFIY